MISMSKEVIKNLIFLKCMRKNLFLLKLVFLPLQIIKGGRDNKGRSGVFFIGKKTSYPYQKG